MKAKGHSQKKKKATVKSLYTKVGRNSIQSNSDIVEFTKDVNMVRGIIAK